MGTEHTPQDTPDADARRRRRSPLTVMAVAAAVLVAGGGVAYWASGDADGDPSGAAGAGSPSAAATPKTAALRVPQDGITRVTVEKLADALGVPGAVKLDGEVWKASGGGATLQVNRTAPGTWSYAREGTAGAGAVTAGKALAEAAPVFKALGLADAKTEASQVTGTLRIARADPVVDGLPTHGWSTTLRVGADGTLTAGYGRLAALEKGDSYPVTGAEAAWKSVSKSSGGDLGIGACPTVVPKESKGATDPGDTAATDDEPGPPEVLPCVPSGNQPLERRGTDFGLSARFVDGVPTLVPSWLFQVAQAGVERTTTLAEPAVEIPAAGQDEPPTGTTAPGTGGKSYSTDGKKLTVHFWGGVCSDYSLAAEESGGTVKVRITGKERKHGMVCIAIAKKMAVSTELANPLGDREVVDATDGEAVPKR